MLIIFLKVLQNKVGQHLVTIYNLVEHLTANQINDDVKESAITAYYYISLILK